MKQDKNQIIYFVIFAIPVVWLGLLLAPFMKDGLINALPYFTIAINQPFQIQFCEYTLKTIFICLLFYLFGISVYVSTIRNTRRNEEYGSASWANIKKVNQKYCHKDYQNNKLFSQNIKMGLDVKRYQRNLNTVVIGGSGAGKTRFYAKPNIMQCNTSFVILDPKGEILRDTGHLLEKEGYMIKVIDLIDMHKSHCYNPFAYIKEDKDILKLITNLIRNTTPKGSTNNDPFWEKSETALLQALMLYLFHEAPVEEQNFTMVMEMIAAAEVKEDDEEYESTLDILSERIG